jgi:hypothetical protein
MHFSVPAFIGTIDPEDQTVSPKETQTVDNDTDLEYEEVLRVAAVASGIELSNDSAERPASATAPDIVPIRPTPALAAIPEPTTVAQRKPAQSSYSLFVTFLRLTVCRPYSPSWWPLPAEYYKCVLYG